MIIIPSRLVRMYALSFSLGNLAGDITKQLRAQILQFCSALRVDRQTSWVCFSRNRFSIVLAFLASLALRVQPGSRPFFFYCSRGVLEYAKIT